MLEKINSFNKLVDALLNEGYFYVPNILFQPIKQDLLKLLKYASFKDNISVPIKNYQIDFNGTKYEFLNKLKPQPSVDVLFTKKAKIKGSFHFSDKFRFKQNKSFIQIDLNDPIRSIYDDMEHEMSHFIQLMIKKYTIQKRQDPSFSGTLGGMPNKKHLSGLESETKHSKIPKEIYPDLLSAIRELQFIFSKASTYREPTTEDKKIFFKLFLDSMNDKDPIGKKASSIFKDFKELPEPLYKKLLKIAYNAFVNKPLNFDPKELLEIGAKIS